MADIVNPFLAHILDELLLITWVAFQIELVCSVIITLGKCLDLLLLFRRQIAETKRNRPSVWQKVISHPPINVLFIEIGPAAQDWRVKITNRAHQVALEKIRTDPELFFQFKLLI